MDLQNILFSALPEAIGGAVVAIVLIAFERWRAHVERKEKEKRAKSAILIELRGYIFSLDAFLQAKPDERHLRNFSIATIATLIRVNLEELGTPSFESALGDIQILSDQFNMSLNQLQFEKLGINRAMSDAAEVNDRRNAQVQLQGTELLSLLRSVKEMVERNH